MTTPQRLFLTSLLAAWTVLVLGCGKGGTEPQAAVSNSTETSEPSGPAKNAEVVGEVGAPHIEPGRKPEEHPSKAKSAVKAEEPAPEVKPAGKGGDTEVAPGTGMAAKAEATLVEKRKAALAAAKIRAEKANRRLTEVKALYREEMKKNVEDRKSNSYLLSRARSAEEYKKVQEAMIKSERASVYPAIRLREAEEEAKRANEALESLEAPDVTLIAPSRRQLYTDKMARRSSVRIGNVLTWPEKSAHIFTVSPDARTLLIGDEKDGPVLYLALPSPVEFGAGDSFNMENKKIRVTAMGDLGRSYDRSQKQRGRRGQVSRTDRSVFSGPVIYGVLLPDGKR